MSGKIGWRGALRGARALGRLLASAYLCATSTGAFAGSAPAVPSGTALLRRVLQQDQRVPYEGRLSVMLASGANSRATITRELHAGFGRARIQYLFPQKAAGRLVVSDGRYRWEYIPANRAVYATEVLRRPTSASEIEHVLTLTARSYALLVDPKPVAVNGRSAYVLHLDPRSRDRHRRTWWVDRATSLVLRREVYDPNGALDSVTSFTTLSFHPRVSKDAFVFKAPAGTRVVHRASPSSVTTVEAARGLAPGWGRVPASVGHGFAFERAQLVRVKGALSLHIQYSDGLVSLSLIEMPGKASVPSTSRRAKSVQVAGKRATVVQVAPFRLLSWNSRGNSFNLVADLAEQTLIDIASAL